MGGGGNSTPLLVISNPLGICGEQNPIPGESAGKKKTTGKKTGHGSSNATHFHHRIAREANQIPLSGKEKSSKKNKSQNRRKKETGVISRTINTFPPSENRKGLTSLLIKGGSMDK